MLISIIVGITTTTTTTIIIIIIIIITAMAIANVKFYNNNK